MNKSNDKKCDFIASFINAMFETDYRHSTHDYISVYFDSLTVIEDNSNELSDSDISHLREYAELLFITYIRTLD